MGSKTTHTSTPPGSFLHIEGRKTPHVLLNDFFAHTLWSQASQPRDLPKKATSLLPFKQYRNASRASRVYCDLADQVLSLAWKH